MELQVSTTHWNPVSLFRVSLFVNPSTIMSNPKLSTVRSINMWQIWILWKELQKLTIYFYANIYPHIYICRKQAKQIQEQLKESQHGKNYSLKTSGALTKSENLMKSHVQLQNVSGMSPRCFCCPPQNLGPEGIKEPVIRTVELITTVAILA